MMLDDVHSAPQGTLDPVSIAGMLGRCPAHDVFCGTGGCMWRGMLD